MVERAKRLAMVERPKRLAMVESEEACHGGESVFKIGKEKQVQSPQVLANLCFLLLIMATHQLDHLKVINLEEQFIRFIDLDSRPLNSLRKILTASPSDLVSATVRLIQTVYTEQHTLSWHH